MQCEGANCLSMLSLGSRCVSIPFQDFIRVSMRISFGCLIKNSLNPVVSMSINLHKSKIKWLKTLYQTVHQGTYLNFGACSEYGENIALKYNYIFLNPVYQLVISVWKILQILCLFNYEILMQTFCLFMLNDISNSLDHLISKSKKISLYMPFIGCWGERNKL